MSNEIMKWNLDMKFKFKNLIKAFSISLILANIFFSRSLTNEMHPKLDDNKNYSRCSLFSLFHFSSSFNPEDNKKTNKREEKC